VISHPEGIEGRNITVVEQLRAVFERDWFSRYTHSVQSNKIPVCSDHQINKMVTVKASHIDTGPLPVRKGQYDNRPAPLRNHRKVDGLTPDKTKNHDDRQRKTDRLQQKGFEPFRNERYDVKFGVRVVLSYSTTHFLFSFISHTDILTL